MNSAASILVSAQDGGAGFVTRVAGAVLALFILYLLIKFLIRNGEHLRARPRRPDDEDDTFGSQP